MIYIYIYNMHAYIYIYLKIQLMKTSNRFKRVRVAAKRRNGRRFVHEALQWSMRKLRMSLSRRCRETSQGPICWSLASLQIASQTSIIWGDWGGFWREQFEYCDTKTDFWWSVDSKLMPFFHHEIAEISFHVVSPVILRQFCKQNDWIFFKNEQTTSPWSPSMFRTVLPIKDTLPGDLL